MSNMQSGEHKAVIASLDIPLGSRLILRKLGVPERPVAPPGDWSGYKLGQANEGVSLPVEYELEGQLVAPIELGRPILVARSKRNGVATPGAFSSSPVCDISVTRVFLLTTYNSVYLICVQGS